MTTSDNNDTEPVSAPSLDGEIPAARGGALHAAHEKDTSCHHAGHTRRKVVSHGIKLAFVAPVISTFFAKDAYAGSGYCSPLGADCAQDSDCCSGVCDSLGSNTCVAAF